MISGALVRDLSFPVCCSRMRLSLRLPCSFSMECQSGKPKASSGKAGVHGERAWRESLVVMLASSQLRNILWSWDRSMSRSQGLNPRANARASSQRKLELVVCLADASLLPRPLWLKTGASRTLRKAALGSCRHSMSSKMNSSLGRVCKGRLRALTLPMAIGLVHLFEACVSMLHVAYVCTSITIT